MKQTENNVPFLRKAIVCQGMEEKGFEDAKPEPPP